MSVAPDASPAVGSAKSYSTVSTVMSGNVVHPVEELEEQVCAGPDEVSDAHVPVVDEPRDGLERGVHLAERLRTCGSHSRPVRGQSDRARVPVEQPVTDDALQGLDRRGTGRAA